MKRVIIRVVVLVLAGCGGGPPHPAMSSQAMNALTQVDTGPPPGRVETLPPRPAGADVWIDGEWLHRHGRWYWLLGRWAKAPAGATYRPWVVVRSVDGTAFYAPGVWVDQDGRPIPPPQPLAFAEATGMGLVSPDGEPEDTGRAMKDAPGQPRLPAPAPPAPAK